jgi:predicted nucleic acid-binding protein
VITAVDTNVISAIWADEPNAASAESLLLEAWARGPLVLCPVVYSELLCHPVIPPSGVEQLLTDANVRIDFDLDQTVWREAGLRFRSYLKRRPRDSAHRRFMADFLVGAHALHSADQLISFNAADFKHDFPDLAISPKCGL